MPGELHNRQLELELLGMALLSDDLAQRVAEQSPDLFYSRAHQCMLRAVQSIVTAGDVVTLGSMIDTMSAATPDETEDAAAHVIAASESIEFATAAGLRNTVERLQKLEARRYVRALSMRLHDAAVNAEDIDAEIAAVAAELLARRVGLRKNQMQHAGALARQIRSELDTDWADDRVTTGLGVLDKRFGKTRPGHLNLITGRPSSGKTALSLQMSSGVAQLTGRPVLYVSLEMTAEECAIRLLARLAEMGIKPLQERKTPPHDPRRPEYDAASSIRGAVKLLERIGLFITDGLCSVADIRRDAMRVMSERGEILGGLFIDRVEKVEDFAVQAERKDEVFATAYCSRAFAALAKDLGVPIWLLAQMNRNSEHRSDKRPILSDLQGSSRLEQDAFCILAVHREKPENPTEPHEAEVHCMKMMNGQTGFVRLMFRPASCQFTEVFSG